MKRFYKIKEKTIYMFRNRVEAGKSLAKQLQQFKNSNAVVLAVPKGGVPVAFEVAKKLGLPMEIIFTKKMKHPHDCLLYTSPSPRDRG